MMTMLFLWYYVHHKQYVRARVCFLHCKVCLEQIPWRQNGKCLVFEEPKDFIYLPENQRSFSLWDICHAPWSRAIHHIKHKTSLLIISWFSNLHTICLPFHIEVWNRLYSVILSISFVCERPMKFWFLASRDTRPPTSRFIYQRLLLTRNHIDQNVKSRR